MFDTKILRSGGARRELFFGGPPPPPPPPPPPNRDGPDRLGPDESRRSLRSGDLVEFKVKKCKDVHLKKLYEVCLNDTSFVS